MRPKDEERPRELYECPLCGERERDPGGWQCDCGGPLINIGRPRDL